MTHAFIELEIYIDDVRPHETKYKKKIFGKKKKASIDGRRVHMSKHKACINGYVAIFILQKIKHNINKTEKWKIKKINDSILQALIYTKQM